MTAQPRPVDPRFYDALFPPATRARFPELFSDGAELDATASSRLDLSDKTGHSEKTGVSVRTNRTPFTDVVAAAVDRLADVDAGRYSWEQSWQAGLDIACGELLDIVREECPGAIPPGPVPLGEVTEPIDLDAKQLGDLALAAVGVEDRRRRNQVVWQQGGSELLVHLKTIRVAVTDGFVFVAVAVETKQTGKVEVTVPFAVGRPDRLAGMVVTTEPVPRGPARIIDGWGEAIIAWAWQVLNDVVGALTARVGVDVEGTPLLPGAIVASKDSLRVIPQASHEFEKAGVGS